jgi:hypothetical protein
MAKAKPIACPLCDTKTVRLEKLTAGIRDFVEWEAQTSYNPHEVTEQAGVLKGLVERWGLPVRTETPTEAT